MSLPSLRAAARIPKALVASRVSPRLCVPLRAATTLNDGANKAHDHSGHFKVRPDVMIVSFH